MKQYTPDKSSLTVLRAAAALSALLLMILTRIFIKIRILMLILTALFAGAALFLMFAYLPMYFNSLSYSADEIEIKKCSGVFFRTKQSIKYTSIQYCTAVTTPFSAYTGLNFIIFYVYGGRLILLFLKSPDIPEILKMSGTNYIDREE